MRLHQSTTCPHCLCLWFLLSQEDALGELLHKLKEGEELALFPGPCPTLQVTKTE